MDITEHQRPKWMRTSLCYFFVLSQTEVALFLIVTSILLARICIGRMYVCMHVCMYVCMYVVGTIQRIMSCHKKWYDHTLYNTWLLARSGIPPFVTTLSSLLKKRFNCHGP